VKRLLFICGSNGIGKTTICKHLVRQLPNSAYVDSEPCRLMNPFVLNDETIPTIRKNISDLIRNYFQCPAVQTVIFSYGFHGRRREIFDGVLQDIADMEYNLIPLLLTCSEEENIRRMCCDHRDAERIQRALQVSRQAFAGVGYPQIDITELSIEDAVSRILSALNLCT
jgi:energy-coupling factor transporter ATP-binding protein EcfA2